jgi:hypothetical protein
MFAPAAPVESVSGIDVAAPRFVAGHFETAVAKKP